MKRKLSFGILILLMIGMLAGCGWTVPRPEIKSGEFNISVTYELNGDVRTISGVYVCEYNGTSWALDGGSSRDWIGYIKGNAFEEQIEIGTAEDGGTICLSLDLSPNYFMGEEIFETSEISEPWLLVKLADAEDGGLSIIHDQQEIEEIYGARIVSYKYDAPIQNTFGLFK